MEFGEILRELLYEWDITQKQLAQDLNLAPSTLGNYVRGVREPDFHTLKAIADYFQVSVDYLIDHHFHDDSDHNTDRLLNIYRSMDIKTRETYLELGSTLLQHMRD